MSRSYDILYGRHSLIPECCIQFFVTQWDGEFARRSAYYEAVQLANFKYVPCPECLVARNKVRIRECERDCGRVCRKDFESQEKPLTNGPTWDILQQGGNNK